MRKIVSKRPTIPYEAAKPLELLKRRLPPTGRKIKLDKCEACVKYKKKVNPLIKHLVKLASAPSPTTLLVAALNALPTVGDVVNEMPQRSS
jgi:hypothetical protein